MRCKNLNFLLLLATVQMLRRSERFRLVKFLHLFPTLVILLLTAIASRTFEMQICFSLPKKSLAELLFCKVECYVISDQCKRCPVSDFRVAVGSHPFHGLVKGFRGAFSTNKVLVEANHKLLCCAVI